MTDLTEQWKKGKLDLDNSYYLKLKDGSLLKCQAIKNTHREEYYKEVAESNDNLYDENKVLKKEISTLVNKMLKVSPELREWLEVNYKEYL